MTNKLLILAADLPQIPAPSASKGWLSKKKLLPILAAVIIIAIIAALMVPQGGAVISLDVDYVVGEKMVYDTTMTISAQMEGPAWPTTAPGQSSNTITNTGQQSIEVVDFDGEYYHLNHTITMTLLNQPFSSSLIEKMNKTGYSTYLFSMGDTQIEIPTGSSSSPASDSYLAQLLSRPEVKAGETITVPYPSISSALQITGDLTIKFNDVEDLTVPAGTYRVFRIDMTSSNLKMGTSGTSITGNIEMSMDVNYQIYLEYGTLRQIKSSVQQTSVLESPMMNMTMQTAVEMTLTEHTKP